MTDRRAAGIAKYDTSDDEADDDNEDEISNDDNEESSEPKDEKEYLAAVERCKAVCANMSGKQWVLGDEADNVATVYGENKLKQFTEDTNFDGVWTTLQRYRDVCRAFPKDRGRPRYFASAQVLASYPEPERFKIVERNPDISKREARAIMRKWRDEQDQAKSDNAAKDDAEADNAGKDDAEADNATTSSSAKAKAKGANKTGKQERENEWSKDNGAWERDVIAIANDAMRAVKFFKRCTREQWLRLVQGGDPSTAATMRRVSEAWGEIADAWDEPSAKETDAPIAESRVKTKQARRASRPVQASV